MSTIPPSPDVPDFSPDALWTPAPLIYESATLSADKSYGPFYVGNYGALSILGFGLAAAVGWQLLLTWYADLAATEAIDGTTFTTNGGNSFAAALANRGPVVALTLSATDYSVARAYKLSIYPRLERAAGAAPIGAGLVFNSTGTVLAAGATTKVGKGLCVYGSGVFSVNATTANWRAVIFQEQADGTTRAVTGAMDGAGGRSNSVGVALNGGVPAVWVNNFDAAAQTFDIGLNVEV